jgi:hypothetical protein
MCIFRYLLEGFENGGQEGPFPVGITVLNIAESITLDCNNTVSIIIIIIIIIIPNLVQK